MLSYLRIYGKSKLIIRREVMTYTYMYIYTYIHIQVIMILELWKTELYGTTSLRNLPLK